MGYSDLFPKLKEVHRQLSQWNSGDSSLDSSVKKHGLKEFKEMVHEIEKIKYYATQLLSHKLPSIKRELEAAEKEEEE